MFATAKFTIHVFVAIGVHRKFSRKGNVEILQPFSVC